MPFLPTKTITAGEKQFSIFQGHYFMADERGLTNAIYLNNDADVAASGTATQTIRNSGGPIETDKFNRPFVPGGARPLVAKKTSYARSVTTATTSGLTYTGTIKSMANDNFIRIIVRNGATARACKLAISDGTNTETYAFTTGSTASTWEGFTFVKATGTATPAAVNYSAVTSINVTDDLTGATLDWAAFYSAAEEIAFPGFEVVTNYDCITAFGKTYTKDSGEVLCGQIIKAYTANKKSFEFEADTKETDIIMRALSVGSTIISHTGKHIKVLGDYTVATNGTCTLPSGQSIAGVVVGGITLQRTDVAVANLQDGQWHYASTTLTVGAGLASQTARVYVYEDITVPAFRDDDLVTGLVGYFQITSTTENGGKRTTIIPKAQLNAGEYSLAQDGDGMKFKHAALAVPPTNHFFIEYES